MSEILLTGGTVLGPSAEAVLDVRIIDGVVAEVAPDLGGSGQVIDIGGSIVGPGFVDLHVHLREPGQEWKEDIASGSAAAAAGGFTAIVAMPNTDPPTDAGHLARYISDRGREVGLVEVVPAGCITLGMEGEALSHLDEMHAAGVRVFTDDGSTVADAGLLRRAMEYMEARPGIIAQHAEDVGLGAGGHMHEGAVSSLLGIPGLPAVAETVIVARDLALVELTGAGYHVQHVSCAATVELIRDAKRRGLPVTAEVAPHHLWLTDRCVESMDPVYKMYPPLRTRHDTEALAAGLGDRTIDAVATDHAPHAAHEKDVPFEEAPRGVIGLETAFSVVRSSVALDPRALFEAMSVAPAAIGNLDRHGRWIEEGMPANLVAVDWDAPWVPDLFVSKSSNSPFRAMSLTGQVRCTIFDGRVTFASGQVIESSEVSTQDGRPVASRVGQ